MVNENDPPNPPRGERAKDMIIIGFMCVAALLFSGLALGFWVMIAQEFLGE